MEALKITLGTAFASTVVIQLSGSSLDVGFEYGITRSKVLPLTIDFAQLGTLPTNLDDLYLMFASDIAGNLNVNAHANLQLELGIDLTRVDANAATAAANAAALAIYDAAYDANYNATCTPQPTCQMAHPPHNPPDYNPPAPTPLPYTTIACP